MAMTKVEFLRRLAGKAAADCIVRATRATLASLSCDANRRQIAPPPKRCYARERSITCHNLTPNLALLMAS